ncbi:MAG: hypothetical protein JWQ63_3852 [Mucilaginibacter sp.]|nr:hypothetical protein [Mucilaginibacter sp.]
MIMKNTKIFIFGFILILIFCNIKSKAKSENQQKTNFLPGYKMVHILRDNQNQELGKVYVNEIKKGIFRHLRILNQKTGTDTLYYVDNLKLKNDKGIDIQVRSDEFYGYKIIFTDPNSITLTIVNNKGVGISDDITIIWNNESKLFQVLKTP